MSAAISNLWWAAKGLLTEQAKDVRQKKTKTNMNMQTNIDSNKHAGINRMGLSSRRQAAVESSRIGRGGSCCLHLSTQQGLDPAG